MARRIPIWCRLGRLIAWLPCAVALAAEPQGQLDEHVNRLTSELRCLVCQNQTVADSQSELAVQLKREVRQQLAQGTSDQQVLDFMVARYGDFILYRPPVNQTTWLLWAGPVLLLLFGVGLYAAAVRGPRHRADGKESDANEEDAAQ